MLGLTKGDLATTLLAVGGTEEAIPSVMIPLRADRLSVPGLPCRQHGRRHGPQAISPSVPEPGLATAAVHAVRDKLQDYRGAEPTAIRVMGSPSSSDYPDQCVGHGCKIAFVQACHTHPTRAHQIDGVLLAQGINFGRAEPCVAEHAALFGKEFD